MTWPEHEAQFCVEVPPPPHAVAFKSYEDACNSQESQELADEMGGFHPVSRWAGQYWLWRE
jgi:hypothetical protein